MIINFCNTNLVMDFNTESLSDYYFSTEHLLNRDIYKGNNMFDITPQKKDNSYYSFEIKKYKKDNIKHSTLEKVIDFKFKCQNTSLFCDKNLFTIKNEDIFFRFLNLSKILNILTIKTLEKLNKEETNEFLEFLDNESSKWNIPSKKTIKMAKELFEKKIDNLSQEIITEEIDKVLDIRNLLQFSIKREVSSFFGGKTNSEIVINPIGLFSALIRVCNYKYYKDLKISENLSQKISNLFQNTFDKISIEKISNTIDKNNDNNVTYLIKNLKVCFSQNNNKDFLEKLKFEEKTPVTTIVFGAVFIISGVGSYVTLLSNKNKDDNKSEKKDLMLNT